MVSLNPSFVKKQDEAHEPECRHVCWRTETIVITFSSKPTCGTPWRDTLRWHSCTTPFLLDTLLRHSYLILITLHLVRHSYWTLLLDTPLGHSYLTFWEDADTWHSSGTLLLDTFVRHFLLDTLVRRSYLTLLIRHLARHSCWTLLLDTPLGHSYLTFL